MSGSAWQSATGSSSSWTRSANRGLRVGDAERDRATAALSRHFTEGRLDHDEFEERLTRACEAKTRGDLDALFFDLPALPVSARDVSLTAATGSQVQPSRRPRRHNLPVLRIFALTMLVLGIAGHPIGWFFFVLTLPVLMLTGAVAGARCLGRYVSDEMGARWPRTPHY